MLSRANALILTETGPYARSVDDFDAGGLRMWARLRAGCSLAARAPADACAVDRAAFIPGGCRPGLRFRRRLRQADAMRRASCHDGGLHADAASHRPECLRRRRYD